MARKAISKKTRFEVFKRDGFKCMYCGQSSPSVVLNVDHIHPVSKGGDNDILNLITSCFDCNAGKSDRKIDDSSFVNLQIKQLQEINEKKEQMKMVLKWREELKNLEKEKNKTIYDYVNGKIDDFGVCISGCYKENLAQAIKKIDVCKAMDCIDDAECSWLDGEDSIQIFLDKIIAYIGMKSMPEEKQKYYYIRGILRKRLSYINENNVLRTIKESHESGFDLDSIEDFAKQARSWSHFVNLAQGL